MTYLGIHAKCYREAFSYWQEIKCGLGIWETPAHELGYAV